MLKNFKLGFSYFECLKMEKKESRRLVVISSFLYLVTVSLLYASCFTSNTAPFDTWKQHFSNLVDGGAARKVIDVLKVSESFKVMFGRLVTGEDRNQLEAIGFACHSVLYSDVCVVNKPVRIDTHAMDIYLPPNQTMPPSQRVVRPYALNYDKNFLNAITPVHILHNNNITQSTCSYTHNVPVLIFSSGGYVGNQFHEFNDIIIPLFLTSRHFKSRVRFLIVDYNPKFVTKYHQIISHLSDYEVINPATNGNTSVHCFPGAIVGLHFHDQLAINYTDVPEGYSMPDFKQFLREAYNLKIWTVSEIEKPVLILMSRVSSRSFLNEDELVGMMKELGFRVIIARPGMMKNLKKFSKLVNSCSVMVGVHGAGLTNELFLPTGAVIVQVVPLGIEWASAYLFGEPANAMGVQYLEYKIRPEESSLYKLYGKDHPVLVDPDSVFSKDDQVGRAIYFSGQHVRIDLFRFRETLVEALGLLGPELI